MPFFLARAGKDQIPDILPGIDAFVGESLAAGTPLVLFNLPEAPHGFDHDPDPSTREAPEASRVIPGRQRASATMPAERLPSVDHRPGALPGLAGSRPPC